MYEQIIQLAIKNGLWAVLFIVLFFYILRDASAREKKYQNTIEKLNDHLKTVNDIKKEVGEIMEIITKPKKIKKVEDENGKEEWRKRS